MRNVVNQSGCGVPRFKFNAVAASVALISSFTPFAYGQAGASALEEVVVTAQRRSQRLVDVPLSVTALSGERLEASGIDDTYDLQLVTPGLRVERLGAYTQPSIRGVTAQSTSPGAEANVALYVDGVYQPNQAANTMDLPDVERVEVLKGPQGTLFGRNATGGAILVHTKNPSYEPEGSVAVSYGRFNNFAGKAFVTAPIIDEKLAFSLAGHYEDMDGWNDDLLDGSIGEVESRLVRGKLLWDPSTAVRLVLSAQYSESRDESTFSYSALDGNTAGIPLAVKPYDVALNQPPLVDVEHWSTSLRGTFTTGFGEFSTLTAYSETDIFISADGDASPSEIISFTIESPDRNFTQEINFVSDQMGPVTITTGLFYYTDDSGYQPLIGNFGGFPFDNYADVTVDAYAGYAEASIDFTDRLTAILGARYSYEKRTVQYTGGAAAAAVGSDRHEETWDSVTPRASLRFDLTDRSSVYATYSEGFKSGVYDLNSTTIVPVEPEEIKAYEVGFKTGQDRYDLNLAFYYYDYTNLQVQINSGGFDILTNAGAAENYGADLEGTFRFTPDLSMNLGIAWLHARYQDYPNATILVPVAGGGNVPVSNSDLSGYKVVRSPSYTANMNLMYEKQLDIGLVGANLQVYHSDEFPLEQSGRIKQDAYTHVNARVSLQPQNTQLRLSVWGKNLADEEIIHGSFFTGGGDQVAYAPPRTYGVSAEYSF